MQYILHNFHGICHYFGVVVVGPVYCAEIVLFSYMISEVVEIPMLFGWLCIPVDSELYQINLQYKTISLFFPYCYFSKDAVTVLQPTKSIYSSCHLCLSIEFKIIKPKYLLFTFKSWISLSFCEVNLLLTSFPFM